MSLPNHPDYPTFDPVSVEDQLKEYEDNPNVRGLAEMTDGRPFYFIGARSVQPPLPTIQQAIDDKLRELEARNILLFQEGTWKKTPEKFVEYTERRRSDKLLDVRAIQMALTDIPRMLTTRLTPELRPNKVKRAHTSYGLKHHLENYRKSKRNPRHGYITNGDFCMAMLLLGFPIRRPARDERNLSFVCVSLVENVEFCGSRTEYRAFMADELDMD
jgi:hypothetical protein